MQPLAFGRKSRSAIYPGSSDFIDIYLPHIFEELYLDHPYGNSEKPLGECLLDTRAQHRVTHPAIMSELREVIKGKIFSCLDEREEQIMEMRFYGEMTLEAIGKIFNLSRERVRQLEAQALRKIRSYLNNGGSELKDELRLYLQM